MSMYTCRFAPDLKTLAYVGDKEKREEMAQRIKADRAKGKLKFQVLITTYEVKILLIIIDFISRG